jgi:signal transduction histidine kinase
MSQILVVEDDPKMRQNLCRVLEKSGYSTEQAANGKECLERLQTLKPDCIVCDLNMPVLDGYQLLEILRKDPQKALIPFIVVSSTTDRETLREAMAQGADDYLSKPFTPDELLHSVRSRIRVQEFHELETQKKLLSKTHFISAVTHDLRNPLGILMLSVDCLDHESDGLPATERRQILQDMRDQINLMNRMLEDILTMGCIENGVLPFTPRPIDLAALSRAVCEECQKLDGNRHRIVAECAAKQIPIETDELLLRQTIVNLVSNAVKYSPEGSMVKVSASNTGERVNISVADEGSGIGQEEIKTLFDPFIRGKNSRKHKGFGYGLYIVKCYVERLGGTITVESAPGKGSTFRINLPLKHK